MRIAICVVMALCLAGCGGAPNLTEMSAQADQLGAALKKEFGGDVPVQMNVNNGTLSTTITIDSSQIQTVTIGEIERKVKQQVAAVVKQPTEVFVVFHFPKQ